MFRLFFFALSSVLLATSSFAKCSANSPATKGRVTFDTADKRVDGAWLTKNIAGHRVKFKEGTEHYENDGSYFYKAGSQRWDAPSYKFYNNGFRCIDYPTPRYDMYVVNDGKLVLINGGGGRHFGKILK